MNPQGMKPVQNRSRVGLSSCNASTYQWCGAVVVVCVVVGLAMQALLSNHHLNTIQHRLEQQHMVWMLGQTTDLQMNFSQASYPRHIQQLSLQETIRGQKISYAYHMGNPQGTATYGNLALVKFGSKYIAAARRSHWAMAYRKHLPWYPQPSMTHRKPADDKIYFWKSSIALCNMSPETLQPISCADFDPRTWEECWWLQGFEAEGPEDPRLFVWPKKGLFMLFGSKPWPHNASGGNLEDLKCDSGMALQQWLVLVQPFSNLSTLDDPWMRGVIRLQYLDDSSNMGSDGLRREKNWVPFIYEDQLLFSQRLVPHRVLAVMPDGSCNKLYETHSNALQGLQPRGNTPAVLVDRTFSGQTMSFYLGVFHIEKNKTYVNHFYKMQAHPPFTILEMSDPIPLEVSPHPWNKDWKSIAFPVSLELVPHPSNNHKVLIGYGSGDAVSHVKPMPWSIVQQLFSNGR